MWGFLSDVRESVRQVVAPSPGVSNAASAAVPSVTSTTTNLREMDFEGAVDQVTTGLLRLWRKVDQTASKVLRQAFDGVFSPREEAVPRLFTLKAEALASLPQDELLDIIRDAISQTNDRMHQALNEANFLLSLGIEEQIAHTNDYTGCYEWWDRTVNRRLIVCQDLLQARFTNTSSTQKQLSTVMALRAQMAAIRDASTQPMAAIAARGRLLEDERYDLLQSFPAIIPTEGSMHPAPVPPPALDYTLSADDHNIHLPHSQPTPTHSVESVGTAIQHAPYKSPFHPLNTSTPPAPATSQHHANTVMLEGCTLSSCAPQLPTEHASLLPALHSTEEQARLERHAEEERLARAAEEQARLERHAEEERLARAAAEEQARLERHAEEERLARAAGASLKHAITSVEERETVERAKLARESQEIFAMLYGKLMMSWQGMVMGTRSRSESRTRVFPALTTSNDDSGWGEDDEFEEINMSHFKREVYSPHRGSSYGAVYPSTPSSTLSGCTQLQTPASAQRDAPMTRRTHTPSATPLPGAQGVGVVETAATVLDRQARGVGFRKKSPPVRVASGSAGLTPVHQSHGCISRSSSLSSPYSAAANPSLARPRPRPAAPQSVFSSPGAAGKQPKRQVQIEDDDKWDDDW